MKHTLRQKISISLLIGLGWSPVLAAQPGEETEIFRIELVTRFDATIDGGGFDTRALVDRRLVKEVSICIDAVRKTAIDWSDSEQLVLALDDRRDTSLVLHFSRPQQAGIFEVLYRVNLSEGYATGGFKYFAPTGFEVPESTQKYRKFAKKLRVAMSCK